MPRQVAFRDEGTSTLTHADLVAVVEDGRPAQEEQHEERAADLGGVAGGPAGGEPDDVMVGQRPDRPTAGGDRGLGLLDDPRAARPLEGRVDSRRS